MTHQVLGLDIGGANLKAVHTSGKGRHIPYALWRNPDGLAEQLRQIRRSAPRHERIAVTMTGELCDCYQSKREGVLAILDAVAKMAPDVPVRVWTNEGHFVDVDMAREQPYAVASANWLALACFVGRMLPAGPCLLIDIGSTTTDIVPLVDGQPQPNGRTDPERLACNELVYLGWKRTPLCAVAAGDVAAEFFATMHDVHLILKNVSEDPADCDTADGQPATREAALRRLARMRCADLETLPVAECLELAQEMVFRWVSRVTQSLNAVVGNLPGPPRAVMVAGSGEFLFRFIRQFNLLDESLRQCSILSLAQTTGDLVGSAAGCALAVAVLASEER